MKTAINGSHQEQTNEKKTRTWCRDLERFNATIERLDDIDLVVDDIFLLHHLSLEFLHGTENAYTLNFSFEKTLRMHDKDKYIDSVRGRERERDRARHMNRYSYNQLSLLIQGHGVQHQSRTR